MNAALPRNGRSIGSLGLMLAIVALAVQLAAASVVPFAALTAATVDRLAAASICHTDQGGQPASPHHAPACAACPLCQIIAHAGTLLAAPPVFLAAPAMLAVRLFSQPPARAPPGLRGFATSARGPPSPT